MKALRCLIGGIVWGIFSNVVHGIFNGGIFKDWYKGFEHLHRPFDSVMMRNLFILSVIMGLVYSFLYLVIHKGIPGESAVKKGLLFGILLFLPQIVGMFFSYAISPGPFPLPCLISGIIVMPLGGMFLALIYGKALELKLE